MNHMLALIGYGEAGRSFAQCGKWAENVCGFDIAPDRAPAMAEDGIRVANSLATALSGANGVLSLVTAGQAEIVASEAARHLSVDAYFFDMNSVAPTSKKASSERIGAVGGRYVDVAIMAPVEPARMAVPLLVSGAWAHDGAAFLRGLGFSNIRIVGDEVGRAATIKMLRSVLNKGIEALTAECLIACERAGVTDELVRSFGDGWADKADYRLDRMMVHGLRRAQEMAEVSKTLEALGVAPLVTQGTAKRQAELGSMGIVSTPNGLTAKLKRLAS